MRRIIYDGDSFYELDEECMKQKKEHERRREAEERMKLSDPGDSSVCRGKKKERD